MADKSQTTFGDRASSGAVNAAWYGGIFAAGALIVNAVRKVGFKSPVKLFGKNDLIFAGAAAAVAGAWSFFTADKSKELKVQHALETISDPNNPASDKERAKQVEKIINDAQNGKMPEETPAAETTKFRDQIAAERSAVAAPSVAAR